MTHLSKRLLAITVLAVLAAVMSVEANSGKEHHNWCVVKPGTPNDQMQDIINFACSQVNCAKIQENGQCYFPNRPKHHASWAMNEYYHKHGAKDCDFNGHGMVVHKYPQDNGGCEHHPKNRPSPPPHTGSHGSKNSWCVAKKGLSHDELQQVIDQLCGGPDIKCTKIQPGNACYSHNSPWKHASWTLNEYYQYHGRNPSRCNYNGRGTVTHNWPGKCFPPIPHQKGRGAQEL